ncbi:hypothetical protein [Streptomyces sp. NBC_00576]|uniref:hypothetical protein n=1 Tax=Streptomyces sp. NBC_00576 TaxID=2903665 RepID=UPI002E7FD880|nr:hypothetical protein [Streptomyces sp. NBC_00576]WUB76593.1 hypothetical protein OG734_44765 [Streptomyces sp. NBC_00576]
MRTHRSLRRTVAAGVLAVSLAGCSATSADTDTKSSSSPSAATTIPEQDGPGVTADSITVVDNYYYDGTAPVDKAVFDAYNAAGGIAGRKLVRADQPQINVPATATAAEQDQAICLAYEQRKDKVFAVLNDVEGSVKLNSCLNKQGTVVQERSGSVVDESLFQDAPFTVGPATLTNERLATSWPALLKSTGFLKGTSKVAVVSDGVANDDKIAASTFVPALEKVAGSTPRLFTFDTTSSDQKALQAQALSMVLKLKQAGIDRIVFFGGGAAGPIAITADKQGLDAQYAWTASGVPAGNGITPAIQAALTGYAWGLTDYGVPVATQQEMLASNPAAGKCLSILTKAHLDLAQNASTALQLCDALNLLKQALEGNGSKYVNAQAFIAGVDKLDTFDSVTTFQSGFGPGRHDGALAMRKSVYERSCTCFRYTGPNLPISG